MIYVIIYLVDVYANLVGLVRFLAVASIVVFILSKLVNYICTDDRDYNESEFDYHRRLVAAEVANKIHKLMYLLIPLFGVMAIFMPSKQAFTTMSAAYVGDITYNKMKDSELFAKAEKLLSYKLDEYLKEYEHKEEKK